MVESLLISTLHRLEKERYHFDRAMEAYMKGALLDAEIALMRENLTKLEDEFTNLVLSMEKELQELRKKT